MSTQRWELYNDPGGDLGTFADPWNSLASAAANVVSDDLITCYDGGSGETLSSAVSIAVAGGGGNTKIIWRGTDASFNVVAGTYYTLDGNSSATNCVAFSGYTGNNVFEHFKMTGATGDGLALGNGNSSFFVDCHFYSNGSDGVSAIFLINTFYRCQFYSNTAYGANIASISNDFRFWYCDFHSNANGVILGDYCTMYRCLVYDNTSVGIEVNGNICNVIGCIVDENGSDGIKTDEEFIAITNTIITNNGGYGINSIGSAKYETADIAFYLNASGVVSDESDRYKITADTILSGDPYANQAGRDYTLTSADTDLVDLEKVVDSNNSSFETIGFIPQTPSGVTPTFAGVTGSQMVSDNHLDLEWSAATGASYYKIYISTSPITYVDGEVADIVPNGVLSTTVCHTGAGVRLQAGTRYYYAVRAWNVSVDAEDANVVTGDYECVGRGGSAPIYVKNGALN